MTHDDLERALRATADPAEAAYAAHPLPATVDEARDRLHDRRGASRPLLLLAAAAAVAVVAAAIVVGPGWLGAADGRGSGSGATSPPASGPSSAASEETRACRAGDFAITSDPWDAGAGSRGTRVIFRAADSQPGCVLVGSLVGRIVDADGVTLVEGSAATPATGAVAGTQLEIGVAWSNWCAADPGPGLTFRVRFPGDAAEVVVVPPVGTEVLVPPCMGAGQPTNLSITPFEPSVRPPPEG